jgi:hypothetical protein
MTTPSPISVTLEPPPAAEPPATPTPAQAAAPDLAALQAKVDALTSQVAEGQRTAEFWYQKATAAPAAAAPAPAATAEEPEVDVLELATRGGKAFEAYLEGWAKKQGWVKGAQMTEAISQKAAELAAQGKMIAEYPELKNEKSEFFQATAVEYGRLKKLGVSEVLAMEMAAQSTELAFLRAGKTKTPAQLKAEGVSAREQERRDRAAAGGGDTGHRRQEASEESEELTPEQRQIAVALLVDGDTTEEQAIEKYKARAKKGVSMRGIR